LQKFSIINKIFKKRNSLTILFTGCFGFFAILLSCSLVDVSVVLGICDCSSSPSGCLSGKSTELAVLSNLTKANELPRINIK